MASSSTAPSRRSRRPAPPSSTLRLGAAKRALCAHKQAALRDQDRRPLHHALRLGSKRRQLQGPQHRGHHGLYLGVGEWFADAAAGAAAEGEEGPGGGAVAEPALGLEAFW